MQNQTRTFNLKWIIWSCRRRCVFLSDLIYSADYKANPLKPLLQLTQNRKNFCIHSLASPVVTVTVST